MAIVLVNPANNYEETVSNAGLWCLIFGSIYFAYKGVWDQAILSCILAIFTLGFSWLVYPFFAEKLIVDHYLRKGWKIKK